MNVHTVMRKARKAANKERFDEARLLYEQALESQELHGNLDLLLRLAWCHDHLGQADEACALYEKVIKQYESNGEAGAAEALQHIVDKIRHPEEGEVKKKEVQQTKQQPSAEKKTKIISHAASLGNAQLISQLKKMAKVVDLKAGDVLCEEGEVSDRLWLLESGVLRVRMPGYDMDEPDNLSPQEGQVILVGEVGVFTQQRRSATVWAESDCHLYSIHVNAIHACEVVGFQQGMDRLLRKYWVEPVLSHHRIFDRINEIDRRNLSLNLESVELSPGECLINLAEEHSGAYLLQRGHLFFLHGGEGEVNAANGMVDGELLSSVAPGDMVHLGGLLHGYQSQYRVIAATPVRLLRFSREYFEDFSVPRPWMIQALLTYCKRPAHLQVMHPEDGYLWATDRIVEL